jgi:hypothetical protein
MTSDVFAICSEPSFGVASELLVWVVSGSWITIYGLVVWVIFRSGWSESDAAVESLSMDFYAYETCLKVSHRQHLLESSNLNSKMAQCSAFYFEWRGRGVESVLGQNT